MGRMKKSEVIARLTELGIQHDVDGDYNYLVSLLPAEKEEETKKEEPKDEINEPKEEPLVVKRVPNGVGTINDHERRLCIIEQKLGLR